MHAGHIPTGLRIPMASTYKYRVHKASWDIAIDLTAEAVPFTAYAGAALEIAADIALAVTIPDLDAEENGYLALGLRLVAQEVRRHTPVGLPLVAHVQKLAFSYTDYQPEGLACALAGWAAQEFGFPAPNIPDMIRSMGSYVVSCTLTPKPCCAPKKSPPTLSILVCPSVSLAKRAINTSRC